MFSMNLTINCHINLKSCYVHLYNSALLHFRTPPIVIDDSSLKNAAESFTVALTLTLGGYESAIAPTTLPSSLVTIFTYTYITTTKLCRKI